MKRAFFLSDLRTCQPR